MLNWRSYTGQFFWAKAHADIMAKKLIGNDEAIDITVYLWKLIAKMSEK